LISEVLFWNAIQEGLSLKDRLVSGGTTEDARMREMSLRRAKAEAAALQGASWGMQEDAEAEEEEVYFLFYLKTMVNWQMFVSDPILLL